MNRLSIRGAIISAMVAIGLAPLPARAACEGSGSARLLLQVTGVRNAAGEVAFTVYPADRAHFLKSHGKIARARVAAVKGVTAACFLLPPGAYAVAVYHDENGDHDFNRTLFAPREGFAFSNDAPATLGLPSLSSTQFGLPAGGRGMRMTMRYP